MCYDVSFTTSVELITDYFPDLIIESELPLNFETNVHFLAQDHRLYPIVIYDGGVHKLKLFEWGVISDYSRKKVEKVWEQLISIAKKQGKEVDTSALNKIEPDADDELRDAILNYKKVLKEAAQDRNFMCNARSEKILDKKSYWYRIRKNRCLIPVTGIYEHREIKGWKNKVPYFVTLKERKLFFIPGLFNYSPDIETGEVIGTYALITETANDVMMKIHNGGENKFRMPLFLPHELERRWLQPDLTDEGIKEILDFQMPSEELDYHPVYSIRGGKLRPDGLAKNEPFVWENLPELGKDTIDSAKLF